VIAKPRLKRARDLEGVMKTELTPVLVGREHKHAYQH
jgi:hypothetical protein